MLSIWWVDHKFIDDVDSIHLLSLSIHWRFQGPQWLYFRCQFVDQPWHSIFDNFISPPWLCFCYQFDVSVMNLLTLSIPNVSCHSVFIDDIKFNRDSVFADDLWICCDIAFLKIPCVTYDSHFAIDLMCRRQFIYYIDSICPLSLSFQWRFQCLQRLSFHWRFMDQQWHNVFDNSMRQPWLKFCYRFDASVVIS